MDQIGDKYRVVEKLGEASGGAFFRVIDQTDEKPYYLDLIGAEAKHLTAKEILAIQLKTRAHSEFKHPYAIPFYPPSVSDDGLILVQNDISGWSLNVILKIKGRPLSEVQAYRTAYSLSSVMAAMHDQNIVHGSLDASHVLISDLGETYVSFLALPDDFDRKNHLYRQPESDPAAEPEFQDDLYAMGVLLTEIFTPLIPFGMADAGSKKKNSQAFEYYRAGLAKLEGDPAEAAFPIILKCLQPNRKQRYDSAIDLFSDMRKVVEAWTNATPGQSIPVLPTLEKPIDQKRATFEDRFKTGSAQPRPKALSSGKKKKKGSLLISFIAAIAVIIGAVILFFYFSEAADRKTISVNYEETLAHLKSTQTALAAGGVVNTAQPGTIVPIKTQRSTLMPTETFTPIPTQTQTPAPIRRQTGAGILWQADQAPMVFVPEGEFTMGMDNDFGFKLDNLIPSHQVFLDSFWLDQHEVSFRQYDLCAAAGQCPASEAASPITSNQEIPVTGISWENASAYCNWAGKRLPTEAEWEKAARGTDGRLYPWGNGSLQYTDVDAWYSSSVQPVMMTDQDISPYGAMFMAGNVSEWVSDYFGSSRMVAAQSSNPVGPVSGAMRTVKGGSASSIDPETAAFAFSRWGADPIRAQDFGFRCAVSDSEVNEDRAAGSSETIKLADAVPPAQPADCTSRIGYVSDVTIPDGSVVRAGEMITKTCVIGPDTKIVWTDPFTTNPQRLFDFDTEIQPNAEAEVSITFPVSGKGRTKINFQFSTINGELFQLGERGRGEFWIEYVVE